MLLRTKIMDFIDLAASRGELVVDDPALAADQFAELCKADIFPRMIFNMTATFTQQEVERVVSGAVEMFMARYGAKK
jgi:hypothetical protein